MKSQKLTAEESFEVIAEMIAQAKGEVQGNAFYYLLWGWVVVFANLATFVLLQLEFDMPYLAWLIVIPAWLTTFFRARSTKQREQVVTHYGRINSWLWISFSITVIVLMIFGPKINFQLSPVILLVTAMPTFLSGVILKFRPLLIGGICFWIVGAICFLVPAEIQPVVSALAIAGGYLVPGYLLKRLKK